MEIPKKKRINMPIHKTAIIDNSSHIDSLSDIGPNVIIEENVTINAHVKIMANAYIGKGTTIGEGTVIHIGAVIGHDPQDFSYKGENTYTIIGKNNIIREYVTIHRGTGVDSKTIIGDNNFIMVQAHLGHNCHIENNVIIANSALLAGYVKVESGVFISGNVVFHQFCRIGRNAMIGGFTGVNKDVPPFMLVRGPSAVRGLNLVGLRRMKMPIEIIRELKEAHRLLFRTDMRQEDAISEIKSKLFSDEIKHLVKFIEESKRGICKYKYQKDEFFE
ncbi:acyl-[acyl-carrier-protein]--UDP-N-acetylglucosamine O-acyltransferase [Candidatus Omnitrophus magneticus]|uniref:Acyl-[acyl-carrier-protein]--UDP-N-acetylglucosamine O-acyltransferase n=1 Tax=Candidatus Omnitrophus magneticus TaxID=1609969 RepID=A0A0F0CT71_9BACT|nr:acyl-[acyl-carrier-protein]--UDP-N-acetylglucosamine O-acyltransferase [Candidatus Omnitrophus magneticus]